MTHSHPGPCAPAHTATRSASATRPRFTRTTVVLRRGDDAVQVGFDTDDTVLLSGVAPALADVLPLIDGLQTLPTLRRAARRRLVPDGQLDGALALLRQAGLVEFRVGREHATRPPAATRLCVVGDGPVATGLASALASSGPAEVILATGPGGSAGPSASGAGPGEGEALITRVRRWPEPHTEPADLTIVATETAEPDRVLAAALVRADQPHLIVRTVGDLAVVGPLVLPGRSACLRCLDLTRTGVDPGWPELLAQLCRTRVPSAEVLTRWVVGTTLVQVHAALRYATGPTPANAPRSTADPPAVLGATVELSGAELAPRLRRWPRHPGCGCGWGGPAE